MKLDRFLEIHKIPKLTEEEIGVNKLNLYLKYLSVNTTLSLDSCYFYSAFTKGSSQYSKARRRNDFEELCIHKWLVATILDSSTLHTSKISFMLWHQLSLPCVRFSNLYL